MMLHSLLISLIKNTIQKTQYNMQNLLLLPSNGERTRLRFDSPFGLKLSSTPLTWRDGRYIYITSDEPIVLSSWYMDWKLGKVKQSIQNDYLTGCFENYKKIVLTTDPKLIEDGIQELNEEFLQWFLENQYCENVGVKVGGMDHNLIWSTRKYSVVLPSPQPIISYTNPLDFTEMVYDSPECNTEIDYLQNFIDGQFGVDDDVLDPRAWDMRDLLHWLKINKYKIVKE